MNWSEIEAIQYMTIPLHIDSVIYIINIKVVSALRLPDLVASGYEKP
jgi:hypothetical protein